MMVGGGQCDSVKGDLKLSECIQPWRKEMEAEDTGWMSHTCTENMASRGFVFAGFLVRPVAMRLARTRREGRGINFSTACL